jgi:hypothetical protein
MKIGNMYKLNTGKVPYMRFKYNIIFFIHKLPKLFIKILLTYTEFGTKYNCTDKMSGK